MKPYHCALSVDHVRERKISGEQNSSQSLGSPWEGIVTLGPPAMLICLSFYVNTAVVIWGALRPLAQMCEPVIRLTNWLSFTV